MAEPSEHTTTDLPENKEINASSATAETSAGPGREGENIPPDLPTEQTDAPQDSFAPDDIQLPLDVSFAPADLKDFKALSAQLDLSKQQIQKLVDFEAACAKRRAEESAAQKQQQCVAWANETKAQYGAALEQEITFALRAANTFGGPELRALLEETGLGNHPVIIRTLSGIGRTISEDACPGGTPAAPQDKTFAEALYGKRN